MRVIGAVLISVALPVAHMHWGEDYPGDGQRAFGFIIMFLMIGIGVGAFYIVLATVLHILLRDKRFRWALLCDSVLIAILVLLLGYAGVTAQYQGYPAQQIAAPDVDTRPSSQSE